MADQNGTKLAENAARVSVIVTTCVVLVKLVGGLMSGSVSVLAEAFQSIVDVVVSIGVWQTVRFASRPADETHPYGHGKAEVLMSAAQMLMITGASVFILYKAYLRLQSPEAIHVDIGLIAMVIAAAADTAVAIYITKVSKITGSSALKSEALHLRGDIMSALGIVIGLLLVRITNYPPLDPIIAILFTLIVIVQAMIQLREVVHQLMDGALPESDVERLKEVLNHHPQVRGYHYVRTRKVGSDRYVELHVLLDDALTFVEAHDLAETIEEELSTALDGANVSIHYEPYEAEMAHRAAHHPTL